MADSHAPRRWKGVPSALASELGTADLILHAGDVCVPQVLDELAEYAPVRVVMGNNDGEAVRDWGAPDELEFLAEGVRIAMIHIAGPRQGRGRRMRRRFPDADVVVFGHSHIPWDGVEDGIHLLNPGSVADPRREPSPTFAVLTVDAGNWSTQIVRFPRAGTR
ncbi:metallophosphoesterase family protein [Tessaracoccus flavus]|uniref:metallophosphoesterase family protein n=1 Tax=Tessaracoccus flavus TaxID=1610493 RepID=UPI001EED776E|nr:YfcE family phosphodiesterase [Tessaracoccus flavus]